MLERACCEILLSAARPAGRGGWIGSWAPGIGDPSAVGWITVALYFVAALACWLVARHQKAALSPLERRFWWILTMALVALGVNKQMDLQSAFTELGRVMATREGWYTYRHKVQRAFILGVGVCAAAGAATLLVLMRRMPAATRVVALGAVALMGFILMRAASFEHVDSFIRSTLWGLRGNWIMEVGAIAVVLAGASWRLYSMTMIAEGQ